MPGTAHDGGQGPQRGEISPPAATPIDAEYLEYLFIVLRNAIREIHYWLVQGDVPGAIGATNGMESALDQASVRLRASDPRPAAPAPSPEILPLLRLQQLQPDRARRNEFQPGQVWCKADGSPDFTVRTVNGSSVEIDWHLESTAPQRHRFEKLDLLKYVINQAIHPAANRS
jgi:hypothetical protein